MLVNMLNCSRIGEGEELKAPYYARLIPNTGNSSFIVAIYI